MLINDMLHEVYNAEQFQFKIGDLSEMAGVSTRQLRYWEKQGYLKSRERTDEQRARVFSFMMYMKAKMIKHFLDEGFTLAKANEKSGEILQDLKWVHKILANSSVRVEQLAGEKVIHFGMLNNDPKQQLYGFVEKDGIHYRTVGQDGK